jgi:hypothetical protein
MPPMKTNQSAQSLPLAAVHRAYPLYMLAFAVFALSQCVLILLDMVVSPVAIWLIITIGSLQGAVVFGALFDRAPRVKRLIFSVVVGRDPSAAELTAHGAKIAMHAAYGAGMPTMLVALMAVLLAPAWPLSINDALVWAVRGRPDLVVLDATAPPAEWPLGLVSLQKLGAVDPSHITNAAHHTQRQGKQRQVFKRERYLGRLAVPQRPVLLIRYECFVEGCRPPWPTATDPGDGAAVVEGFLVADARRAWGDGLSYEDEAHVILLVGEKGRGYGWVVVVAVLLGVMPAVGVVGVGLYWRKMLLGVAVPDFRQEALSTPPAPAFKPAANKKRKRNKRQKK